MRIPAFAAVLLLAGCTPAPPPVIPQQPPPVRPVPQSRGLIGLTAGELVQRFGSPVLQIREGAGLKLQFRTTACVLDAYLYAPPAGQGIERVAHVDARLRSGADTDQAGCVAALSAP